MKKENWKENFFFFVRKKLVKKLTYIKSVALWNVLRIKNNVCTFIQLNQVIDIMHRENRGDVILSQWKEEEEEGKNEIKLSFNQDWVGLLHDGIIFKNKKYEKLIL